MIHVVLAHSWLWHLLGPIRSTWWPETGQGYAFGSSWGGDTALLGIFVLMWHRLNCHAARCWRPGRYRLDVEGGHFMVCRRHHANTLVRDGKLSAHGIHRLHREYKRRREARGDG